MRWLTEAGEGNVFGLAREMLPQVVEISLRRSEGKAEEEGKLLWELIRFVGV
jgi:hypothetical protein